jgi:hypothetical protein
VTVLPITPEAVSPAVQRVLHRLVDAQPSGARRWHAPCPLHGVGCAFTVTQMPDGSARLACERRGTFTQFLSALDLRREDCAAGATPLGQEPTTDPATLLRERELVGAALDNPGEVVPLLVARGFDVRVLPSVFERALLTTIIAQYARLGQLDILLLAEEVARTGVSDRATAKNAVAFHLTSGLDVTAVSERCRLLEQAAATRRLRAQLSAAQAMAANPDIPPEALVSELQQLLDEAAATVGGEPALPPIVRLLDAPPAPPITWAIADLWTDGDFGLLVGDGGSFKTTCALHMGGAIAGGYPVFDRFATRRRPVLMLSAEDPQGVIQQRAEAFVAGHDWDADRVLSNLHVLASPDASLADRRWQRYLEAAVDRLQPGFIIMDPLADLLGGDENSNSDARPMLKWVRSLGARSGAAIAMVHHAGKAGSDKRPLDRVRGASAIPSAARAIYFFDFQPDGVNVEPLKLSRATRPEKFVLGRHIEHTPENRAVWTKARLSFTRATVQVQSRAELFILAQLRTMHGQARLTTSGFKERAHGTGISGEDIGVALKVLAARMQIDYLPGPRGAKLWGLTDRLRDFREAAAGVPTEPESEPELEDVEAEYA